MKPVIKIVAPKYALESRQSRIDHAQVCNEDFVERSYYYLHTETKQRFYDLAAGIAWPLKIPKDASLNAPGEPGYLCIIGILKEDNIPPEKARFYMLEEFEGERLEDLIDGALKLRAKYGYHTTSNLLRIWMGDDGRFQDTLGVINSQITRKQGDDNAILIAPPYDWEHPQRFDIFFKALQSGLVKTSRRLIIGNCPKFRNKLMAFTEDSPSILCVGGLVHTLFMQTMWMDHGTDNVFELD